MEEGIFAQREQLAARIAANPQLQEQLRGLKTSLTAVKERQSELLKKKESKILKLPSRALEAENKLEEKERELLELRHRSDNASITSIMVLLKARLKNDRLRDEISESEENLVFPLLLFIIFFIIYIVYIQENVEGRMLH